MVRKKCPGQGALAHEEAAREASVSDVGTHKPEFKNSKCYYKYYD